jgi:hypothetical protein
MFGCLGVLALVFAFFAVSVATKSGNPAALLGVLFGALPIVVLAVARRFAVATLDDRGLTLRSGKHYPWAELVAIEDVTILRNNVRSEQKQATFRGGTVRMRPAEYVNWGDMKAYLEHAERRRRGG